jgi:hypothetical protein
MIREKLIAFFRAEIDAEEQWGFPRLNRIPEHFLQDRLNHYRGLSDAEKERYKDCSATFASGVTSKAANGGHFKTGQRNVAWD